MYCGKYFTLYLDKYYRTSKVACDYEERKDKLTINLYGIWILPLKSCNILLFRRRHDAHFTVRKKSIEAYGK